MSLSIEDQAKLGGSDMAGLLGLSPWATPLSIYARVVSALEGRPLKDEDSSPKRRGRHLEWAVMNLYEAETGYLVMRGPASEPLARPYQRMSLDAVAYTTTNADDRRVVEVKTAGLSEIRQWGETGTDAIPQGYLFQCTWYLGHALRTQMVDLPTADVAALVAGDLRVYHVPYDAELFAMLEATAERFWVDHVLPRRPPPVTEPLRDVDAVGSLYPRHTGDARQLDSFGAEEQHVIREYLLARNDRKRAEGIEAFWEAKTKMTLGTTPRLEGLPPDTGAKALTWRQSRARIYTDWGAVALELAEHVSGPEYNHIVDKHTTTKDGARPLRVTERDEE